MGKQVNEKGKGLRYNSGKPRMGLLPPRALEEIAKVFTFGAEKYTVRDEHGEIVVLGDHNWKSGMSWSTVLDSLERHIKAFKEREDFDQDSGLYHLAHAGCNIMFLLEYYKIYPEGDDRWAGFVPRIGIDIDDVLADFVNGYCLKYDKKLPSSWSFDPKIDENLKNLDDHFWLNLGKIMRESDLPFEPIVYITSRPESLREVTEKWLFEKNSYPRADLLMGVDKAIACDDYSLDYFIDDSFSNYCNIRDNSKATPFLFNASHNQRFSVGHFRINDLQRFSY